MIQVGLPSKDQSLLKQILPVLKRADLDSVSRSARTSSDFIGLQVTVERREGCVSDSTFSSTLFIQHQSTTTVTLRCFTLQVTTVISLSDAGCLSITAAEPDVLHKAWSWTRRRHLRDHKHSRTLSSYLQQLLQADLDEYGNDRRLFIYILISIYEAISLMLSLVTGLWVKVLALNFTLAFLISGARSHKQAFTAAAEPQSRLLLCNNVEQVCKRRVTSSLF